MVSSAQMVCPKGYYIAIVTTIAETNANHHLELEPGLALLGKIEEQFMVSPFQYALRPPHTNSSFRVHQSHSTSHSSLASTTTSSSPRATMPHLISRPWQPTQRTSTAELWARKWSSPSWERSWVRIRIRLNDSSIGLGATHWYKVAIAFGVCMSLLNLGSYSVWL